MRALDFPDLPQAPVRLCALSQDAPEVIAALEGKGIEVAPVPPSPWLPDPVASHGDMQLRTLGGGKALVARGSSRLKEHLFQKGIEVLETANYPGKAYPQDIFLNYLILDGFCCGHKGGMARELWTHCLETGLEMIAVAQGYARCSVAVAGRNLAITADRTLHQILSQRRVHTLLIDPGDISLPGYDTGFIGGCCGLIDRSLLAFTGSLEGYSQGPAIQRFLHDHGVKCCSLTDGPMADVGGIIPLMERDAGERDG